LAVDFFSAADFTTMPWRNGLGETVELLRADGPSGFTWRISRAAIVENGAFSQFPNIDRMLVLLEGDGILLHFPNESRRLDENFGMIAFPGDVAVNCELLGGACRDLNIMTDRRFFVADVFKHHEDTVVSSTGLSVFYPLSGSWAVNGSILAPETLCAARDEVLVNLTGRGVLLQVDLRPATAA
jgi:environmental stress-induced protein Ves